MRTATPAPPAIEQGTFPAGLLLSPDALKLVIILGLFNWLALFLASRGQVLDFSVLYTAGGVIAEGHRTQLFDASTQTEFQHRILAMRGLLPFNHLAYESLLFIPLALLPFKVALWIWRAISLAMLVASTRLLSNSFKSSNTQTLLLSFALFPIVLAIVQGQDSIVLLLLFSASIALLTHGQERSAGALLALALFKPHLVLPIAAILIWKRGYRFWQGLLGGGLAVILVSIAITGLAGWRQMTALMGYAASGTGDQVGGIADARPNIRGLAGLLGFTGHSALILTIALSAVLFLVVAWRLRTQRQPQLLFPPLVALAVLTSIHINAHDLAILFIPLLALLLQGKKSASIAAAACLSMPIFLLTGHTTLYFFAICAVLYLTLPAPALDLRVSS
jgi:hypothetical protein